MRTTLFRTIFISVFIAVFSLFPYAQAANPVKTFKVSPYQVIKINQRSSCLTSRLSLLHPTNWYAQAELKIVNNCSSSQKLNHAIVSFQSNSNNISAMWGGVNSSAEFTYKGNIASTVLNIQNDPLLIGKTLVLNFGINLTGTVFNLAAANNTLTVIPQTSTPTNGEIDVTVDPSGVIEETGSAEIDITGPGLASPYIILNSTWNVPTIYKVTGLAYGDYAITAKPIGNTYLGSAVPSTVSLNSPTPAGVRVSYQLAPAIGSLQLNLGQAPMSGLATTVNATVSDDTNHQSQVVNIAWNSYKLIPNLPVGDHYTVTFPEVSNGILFSIPESISHPMILQNRTTPLNIAYQQPQPMPSQSVVFNVSGLTDGVLGTLKIVDSYGNEFSQSGFSNGMLTQALPVNNSFAVNVTAPNMYATVSPGSFTLQNGTPAPTVTVQFTANPPPSLSSHFYAYSDSGMQSSGNGLVPPKGGNMVEAFILYNPWQKKSTLWAIEPGDPYSQIIKNTPNTFASVGGANAPYPWDYETVSQGVAEIEWLVDYYHFVGIDFDVEGAALETPSAQNWVAAAVLQLHKDRPSLILTLTVPDPVIGFTTGTLVILNKTLDANNHKMVFDWINKMDFDENGLGDGCTQTDTNMNNNCLVTSATTAAAQLASILGIDTQQAYQYVGEIFMIPVDDQGHPLSLALATQVATTLKDKGVTHMGYWRIQNDDANFTYGNMYTKLLGLS